MANRLCNHFNEATIMTLFHFSHYLFWLRNDPFEECCTRVFKNAFSLYLSHLTYVHSNFAIELANPLTIPLPSQKGEVDLSR